MGSKKKVTVGYRYYIGMHQVYAMSPPDFPVQEVSRIRVGEKTVWTGSLAANGTAAVNAPDAFGGEKKEGGVVGNVDALFGAPTQGLNSYLQAKLTGQPLPAFRGVLSLVLRQVYVAALNPYIKPWAIFARRNTSPWYSVKSAIGADMNPAHIIRDALTSVQYGLAVSGGRVDDAFFQAVADTLHTEGLGLSVFWQSDRQSVEDFIGSMLEIIDGSLYEDQASGKWRLRLAREDYSVAALPVFDGSNIVRVERFSQPLPGDLVSEVIVKFRDRETGQPGSVSAHDIAVLAIQGGRPVRVTRDMEPIPTATLAGKIAARELRQLATPLAKATLIVNRQAWNLNLGDVFRWQWAPYGIQDMVMRVASVGRGTLTDGRIRIECVQDIFSVASAIYATPPSSAWTSPVSAPAPSPYRLLIEAPYWVVAREIVGESDTLLAEIDPLAGLLMSAGSRPASDAYDYRLLTRAGSAAYADRGAGSFCPVAELTAGVGKTDTVLAITNEIDTDLVELDSWAALNGELVKIKAISAGSVTVARGVLDTVPVAHAAGSRIFFADVHRAVDETEWASGQTVNAKLLTRTGLGTLAEAAAPADSLIMAKRFIRPYPPGNPLVNGSAYPEWIDGQSDLALTWAHRDRKAQTAYLVEQGEGNIGPEAGQTYTLRIYGESDTLVRTVTGLTGTAYTYAKVDEEADSGVSRRNGKLRVQLESVRDGHASWQFHEHTVLREGYGFNYGYYYGGK